MDWFLYDRELRHERVKVSLYKIVKTEYKKELKQCFEKTCFEKLLLRNFEKIKHLKVSIFSEFTDFRLATLIKESITEFFF